MGDPLCCQRRYFDRAAALATSTRIGQSIVSNTCEYSRTQRDLTSPRWRRTRMTTSVGGGRATPPSNARGHIGAPGSGEEVRHVAGDESEGPSAGTALQHAHDHPA